MDINFKKVLPKTTKNTQSCLGVFCVFVVSGKKAGCLKLTAADFSRFLKIFKFNLNMISAFSRSCSFV